MRINIITLRSRLFQLDFFFAISYFFVVHFWLFWLLVVDLIFRIYLFLISIYGYLRLALSCFWIGYLYWQGKSDDKDVYRFSWLLYIFWVIFSILFIYESITLLLAFLILWYPFFYRNQCVCLSFWLQSVILLLICYGL